MMLPVTEDLLLQMSDCNSLDEIEVLSFKHVEDGRPENEKKKNVLKVVSRCMNIQIMYLQNNEMNVRDLSYLQTFENLKKIDLSNNSLESLPPATVFQGLISLQFLYLHNNNLSKWQDLQALVALPKILHITLFGNPVCAIPGYRHFIVNSISGLRALDNYVITDEERIEDASFGNRFRGLNEYMKWHIPDYSDEPNADQHKFNLDVDIYRLQRCYERNSPSILIQSLFRGYKSRNFFKFYFKQRTANALHIQRHVRGWLQRKKFMQDLKDLLAYTGDQDLLLSTEEIKRRDNARIIFRNMYRYWKKKKEEREVLAATLKIQAYYRGRFVKHSSFVNLLQLSQFPKIYFLKEQKPQFVKILHSQIAILQQENLTIDDALECIVEDRKFETIRVEEPDLFEWKPLPLLQFLMPTFGKKTIIRYNKSLGLDKRQIPEFSLKDFLYTDNPKSTNHMMTKLRKRDYNLKKSNLKAQLANRKKKTFLNQMVFFDKYNDFLVFEGPSVKLVLSILFAILDYNRTIDTNEDQQFLCFFEPLLDRAAKLTMIQQNIRAAHFRRSLKQYPIYMIIQRRAAYRIQEWWRNLKFKKRVMALAKIRQHAALINSPTLYIEQTLYNNIEDVIHGALSGFRFTEQLVMFDFNPTTFSVHMAIDEEPNNGVYRYKQLSVPKWFDVSLRPPDFMQSPYINKLAALFHFTQEDCQILPSTSIIQYQNCKMDIDRNLYYLQINCGSIEEARRRAIVMAYLTYDMTRHLFVKLATSQMLEDPFIHQNIYDSHEIFGLEIKNEEVDVKALLCHQAAQPHQGMISSVKDAQILQQTTKFKSVELNEKNLFISVRDQYEGNKLDQEILNYHRETELDTSDFAPAYEASQKIQQKMLDSRGEKGTHQQLDKTAEAGGLKMSLWETRKLNEHHQSLMKEQLWQQKHMETQIYREEKKMYLNEAFKGTNTHVDKVRQEVAKHREINRIIKTEQNNELTKNLSVFLNLNNEERILRQELVDKQHELQAKEKSLKIANVVHQNKVRHLKREERDKFIGSFIQAKNLIEKQMKIGNHIRDKKHVKDQNKKKVQTVKNSKIDEQMALPITTKQIDGGMLLDAELSTQRSSSKNFYSSSAEKYSKKGFAIKRGRSQQMATAPQPQVNISQNFYGEKNGGVGVPPRRSIAAQSATRRNPIPLYNAKQSGLKMPSNRTSMAFPALNQTSFSDQYKTFKAMGGFMKSTLGAPNDIGMSRDLQIKIRPAASNKPYYRRSFKGPPQVLQEPQLMTNQANLLGQIGEQSVFQANASHMISSPFTGGLGDATTAAAFNDQSMMIRSPNDLLPPQHHMQMMNNSQMQQQEMGYDHSTMTGGQGVNHSAFLSPVNAIHQYASQQ